MKTDEIIQRYVKSIQDTIIVAEHNHDIWWIYKSKETRPRFVDVMSNYLAFFQTSIHAHFVAMIIALYRLYETRRDTISLPQLLKILDRDHPLSDNAMNRVTELMPKAKRLWVKIGIVRSEAFAHLSDGEDIEDSFKKADLKYRDFKDLIELSKTIINAINQDYNRNVHAFNLSAEFDTKALLTDLLSLWSHRNEKK
ncbi:MAG TPA: hypothetical protein PLR60_04385 [Syntrophorhabdaceae bacterium]|nr:hypothetical protein [Syntrophorhabdaceae bacterium]